MVDNKGDRRTRKDYMVGKRLLFSILIGQVPISTMRHTTAYELGNTFRDGKENLTKPAAIWL